MSVLHVDSNFHKQSMKIGNYIKIKKLIDSSIVQSTVIQPLEGKRPKLSSLKEGTLILKMVLILFVV